MGSSAQQVMESRKPGPKGRPSKWASFPPRVGRGDFGLPRLPRKSLAPVAPALTVRFSGKLWNFVGLSGVRETRPVLCLKAWA